MVQFSARAADLKGSPIRGMLNVANQPGMISFAGGLPASDSFADIAIGAPPLDILQYGPTEGEPGLRQKMSEELAGMGLDCPAERILVLSGSQQGIDLVAKLMIDPGAHVAVEAPAYLAALQVFSFFGARFTAIDPPDPAASWALDPPALAYVTPTFQNPTGRCWTAQQRAPLAQACEERGVLLFEDDPYRDLVYDSCDRTPVCSRMREGAWVYQGSFSKTVAPGLRLGFLAASEDIFPHLAHLKQAADLHSNRLSQWIVLNYLNAPGRTARIAALVDRYRRRRDLFDAGLQRHLGHLATWQVPAGGLFFWVTLTGGVDVEALLAKAVARKVLFTPGSHFYAPGHAAAPAIRLNFSHPGEAEAEAGLAVLGELLREAGS